MAFTPEKHGLSELEYRRAKQDCEAPYKVPGWVSAGPVGVSALVGAVASSREQEGREAFKSCMAQRGFTCTNNCVTSTSLERGATQEAATRLPIQQTKAQTKPGDSISVGAIAMPASEPMALYKEATRNSERIDRLSKSSILEIKEISGDWIKVVTASGSQGWVIGPLVSKNLNHSD